VNHRPPPESRRGTTTPRTATPDPRESDRQAAALLLRAALRAADPFERGLLRRRAAKLILARSAAGPDRSLLGSRTWG
jgi:hypothetical protein